MKIKNKLNWINSPKFRVILCLSVLFISTGAGCKKKKPDVTSTPPDNTNTDSTTQNLSYVSLIKKHTNLIKSVLFDTTYQPYKGFKVTELKYLNNSSQHLAVFFLTADLSNSTISLEVGTGYDKPDFKHQTVTNMITYKNADEPSEEVIAAVNGDYWSVHESEGVLGHPLGIEYKNGIMIKDWPTHPPGGKYYFFATLKNKKAIIGSVSDYFAVKDSIEEGLGGRYLLLFHGHNLSGLLPQNILNPRTSVGLLNPTKVVFIVVDGRKSGYSVGVSLQTLETLFAAIGATDALNLDGGGSTTLVLKKGVNYVTENRPSDGQERAVDNSWMVMYKK